MADGAPLPDLLLCWPFYQENYGSAVMAFCQQKLQQTAIVNIQRIKKNKVKNELR
jgi:hypothetical protein